AEDQHSILLQIPEPLGQSDEDDRGDHDADLASHAAEHDDREDQGGFHEGETLGADEALTGREERAREASEHGTDRKRGELGVRGIDPEGAAGDLVLAQCLPGTPDRQPADTQREEIGDQGESEDQVVEKHDAVEAAVLEAEKLVEGDLALGWPPRELEPEEAGARYVGDAVRAARHRIPVQQDNADDLAEAEGDDG